MEMFMLIRAYPLMLYLSLPAVWQNSANSVAQLCHQYGTILPTYWQNWRKHVYSWIIRSV
ncbi:MAG: hypothetical protein IJ413_02640 [Bacteroides sp.]|nr:hypothetical protein [Bacteroides sp.]